MFSRYRTLVATITTAGASGGFKINALARAEEAQTQTAEPQSWTQHNATMPYWHNEVTGESTWVQPTDVAVAVPLAVAVPAVAAEVVSSTKDSAAGISRSVTSAVFSSVSSGVKWDKNWDKPESTEAGSEPSKAVHHIVLIRHGQYCKGTDDDVDRLLTEKGVEQALRAGKRLQELINGGRVPPIKTLYKSTMIRAAQTADLILANLDPATLQGPGQVQACSMIREGACAVPEPEISRASWDVCETDFHRDSIRIESAFRNHVHRADKGSQESYTTVLVCHGNVIRYLTMRALQLDPQAWLRLSVANGSMTVLSVYPSGKVSLSVLGDVGHLPADLITYN